MVLRDWFDIIIDCGTILKHDTNVLEALSLRGTAHMYIGEEDTGYAHFRQCLKSDPEHKQCKNEYRKFKKMSSLEENGLKDMSIGDFQAAAEKVSVRNFWKITFFCF